MHDAPAQVAADSTLLVTFGKGVTFAQFLESATARREGWLRITREATIAPDVLARARAVGGSWRLMVIARDACGDSMNSVPYAARLADSLPNLTLRIVSPNDGEIVSRAHRTMDGRTATPTFILMNESGTEAGCLVELPAPLRQWTDSARATAGTDSLHAYRSTFYAKDRGASISRELVELLESAKAGTPRCDRQAVR
ncbi:MAG TPA: thioredoxin family protein [Gemmatimonadaceae bacterium]|nr:thioredoxin family protein [Gemmatimonadaceae bacterium]